MKRLGGLLVAAGLVALPAAAQPPNASRIDPAPGALTARPAENSVAARLAMRTFAACLMRNNPRASAEILLQPYGSAEQQAVIERRVAGTHNCMRSEMRLLFHPGALAGALSEAGLATRFASANLGRVTNLAADSITIFDLNPRNGLEELGLCVARRAPEAVRAWALSEPGSAAETNARRAVIPEISPCVDQGQPLHADVVGLRAILSAGLYRALWKTRP